MGCLICFAFASAKVFDQNLVDCPGAKRFYSENDTLARIGTSCFQQLLEHNVHKLSTARWERVITSFVRLFKTTTPHQLFDEDLRTEQTNSPGTPDNTGRHSSSHHLCSLV